MIRAVVAWAVAALVWVVAVAQAAVSATSPAVAQAVAWAVAVTTALEVDTVVAVVSVVKVWVGKVGMGPQEAHAMTTPQVEDKGWVENKGWVGATTTQGVNLAATKAVWVDLDMGNLAETPIDFV